MAYWMHLTPSAIDNILKQESFTLQELLEEEDLVQECKCCNTALLDFLTKPETIHELLTLMTQPDVDHPKAQLYSKKAAEVLLCDASAISKAVVGNEDHMTHLLAFLQQDSTGDCAGDLALAGNFARMIMNLSNCYPEEVLETLDKHPEFFSQLVAKLHLDSFKEMLTQLLTAQTEEPCHVITCWLWQNTVVKDLLEKLSSSEDLDTHCNVAAVLRELAESTRAGPQVLTELSTSENMQMLLGMLEDSEDDARCANVLVVLAGVVAQGTSALDEFDLSPCADPDANVAGIIAGAMGTMHGLLQKVPDQEIHFPMGVLRPVLGMMRLRCVEFLALAVRAYKTGPAASQLHDKIVEHSILPCLIQLLFDHPWHNVLHISIDDIIQHCLYSTNDSLRIALIDQASLHTRLTESLNAHCPQPAKPADGAAPENTSETAEETAPAAEQAHEDPLDKAFEDDLAAQSPKPAVGGDSTEPVSQSSTATGNMGCVIGLAQALVEAAGNHECLQTRLEKEPEWQAAVENILNEELRKQSLELGRSEHQQYVVGDSSSEDEQHYIHHSSSDEEDDITFQTGGVQNRITDAFATPETTFHDDSNAWGSAGKWTTSSDWVATFEDNSTNSAGFDGSNPNEFSMVEDPWADQAPEEVPQDTQNWGAGPAWQANFGGAEEPQESGPAWNACFEASETVDLEGAMLEPVDEGVVADVVEEEVVEEEVEESVRAEVVEEDNTVHVGDI